MGRAGTLGRPAPTPAMHIGSLETARIISAFQRHVPGCYVRDYRDNGGYITVCRDYRDILWNDQTVTRKVERTVPAVTLLNLPRGWITRRTIFSGLRLHRPGWRQEFERAAKHLSESQMRAITKELGAGEVFEGIH